MAETVEPPPPPAELGESGAALWASVMDAYELEPHEERLLLQIARAADTLDELAAIVAREGHMIAARNGELRAHPALVESRQLAIAYARLVAALRIPLGDDEQSGRGQKRVGVRGIYGVA